MMSTVIWQELCFCLWSFGTGVLLAFGYDLLRAFRRIFLQGWILVSLGDLLYFLFAGIVVFLVIWYKNNGILRLFSVVVLTGGALMYHFTLSPAIIFLFSEFLFRPFCIIYKKIKEIGHKLLKNVRKEFKMKRIEQGDDR